METMRTYVLGVDPGTVTGMALAMFYNDTLARPAAVWSDQLQWDEASDALALRLRELAALTANQDGSAALAVGERFVVNAKTAQRGQGPAEDAMGMLGVLRREARLAGVQVAPLQKASDVMTLVQDQALKNLGLHSPSLVHCNDAYRHVVGCALKRRLLLPTYLLGRVPR